ncbi:MAG: hypothetical protein ACKVOQ_05210 [Cyclobacteriaceae bacterium]
MVNTTQRLQLAAAPRQIIINEVSFEKNNQSFNCGKVGEVSLKNKANIVTIYNVQN